MHEPVGEYVLSLSLSFAMNMFGVSRKSVEKYHYEFQCANPIISGYINLDAFTFQFRHKCHKWFVLL